MKKIKIVFLLSLFALAVAGCSKGDTAPDTGNTAGVEVRLSAGSQPATRALFAAETPVTVYVYRRVSAGVMNLSAAPYKTAVGKTLAGSGERSPILLTGGDINGSGRFTLETGYTYDFVLVANPPSDHSKPSVGVVNLGVMNGIPHGVDLLAGRKDGVAVAEGAATTVDVVFTDGGADVDGNLPHLCSGISVEGNAAEELIAAVPNLQFSIARVLFKNLPASANLNFSASPMALSVVAANYAEVYTMTANTAPMAITDAAQKVNYDGGVMLPFALKYPGVQSFNLIDIDFYFGVNGSEVMLGAKNVQLPAFAPGYRYKFVVSLAPSGVPGGGINLYLVIDKWDSLNWDSPMGGDDENRLRLTVAAWSAATWSAVMGQDDTNDRMLLTVLGWSSATWTTFMGGTNADGTNN